MTLDAYLKSQRSLLEAEALAHARAMQESRQLDNRMRDAYSQLRRSAYELGTSSAAVDDLGGVRIKPSSAGGRSHSRDVTLLENGMIVEHVDVKKEEREERERRKREERRERSRARKSSRGSAADVTSIYSVQSFSPVADNAGSTPYSRYSQNLAGRPTSVLTAPPLGQLGIPRQHSQASFSDVQSLGSASPRGRFFGFKNLSGGWMSQDSLAPSGMSGSMVDMQYVWISASLSLSDHDHSVALQREAYHPPPVGRSIQRPHTSAGAGPNDALPPNFVAPVDKSDTKSKKTKRGFAKIWRIVTGNKSDMTLNTRSTKADDDAPLAPPPPLSYLAGDINLNSPRHASTPSLPSSISPRNGMPSPAMSPGTAPSSILPSPVSSRPSAAERDAIVGIRQAARSAEDPEIVEFDDSSKTPSKTLHSMTSDQDLGSRTTASQNSQTTVSSPAMARPPPSPRPQSMTIREKSLPPLPPAMENGERRPRIGFPSQDPRPQTIFTYDSRDMPLGNDPRAQGFAPPQAAFRGTDGRRQSFSGMLPDHGRNTMPARGALRSQDQLRIAGDRYNEFGSSHRSLGPIQMMPQQQAATKRRSKFGFTSLFGKKQASPSQDMVMYPGGYAPEFAVRSYEGDDVTSANGYATSASKHSATSAGGPTRMSLASRKAIDELVEQDREFLAYRYPSNDHGLELQR